MPENTLSVVWEKNLIENLACSLLINVSKLVLSVSVKLHVVASQEFTLLQSFIFFHEHVFKMSQKQKKNMLVNFREVRTYINYRYENLNFQDILKRNVPQLTIKETAYIIYHTIVSLLRIFT